MAGSISSAHVLRLPKHLALCRPEQRTQVDAAIAGESPAHFLVDRRGLRLRDIYTATTSVRGGAAGCSKARRMVAIDLGQDSTRAVELLKPDEVGSYAEGAPGAKATRARSTMAFTYSASTGWPETSKR